MEYQFPIDVDRFLNGSYKTNALLVNNGKGIKGLKNENNTQKPGLP